MPATGNITKNASKLAGNLVDFERSAAPKALDAERALLERSFKQPPPALDVKKADTAFASVVPNDINKANSAMRNARMKDAPVHPAQSNPTGKLDYLMKNPMMGGMVAAGFMNLIANGLSGTGRLTETLFKVGNSETMSKIGEGANKGFSAAANGTHLVGTGLMTPLTAVQGGYYSAVNDAANMTSNAVYATSDAFARHAGFGQTISGKLSYLGDVLVDIEQPIKETVGRSFNQTFDKAGEVTSGLLGKMNVNGAEKAGDHVRNVPELFSNTIGKQSIAKTSYQATAVVGSFARNKNIITTFNSQFNDLTELYAELKGVDVADTNRMQVMFDKDVPPLVDKIRSHMMRDIPASMMISLATDGMAHKMSGIYRSPAERASGNAGAEFAMIIGLGMVQAGVGAVLSKVMEPDPVLKLYANMKEAHETVGFIPKNMIAEALTGLSPTLRPKGGVDEAMQQLSMKYAQEAVTPQQLMRDVASGAAAANYQQIAGELHKNSPPETAEIQGAVLDGRVQDMQRMNEAGV